VWNTQLTPLSFLERAADVFRDREAITSSRKSYTYGEMATAVTRFAHALTSAGIGEGDRVACLLPNLPEMLLAHFAVPLQRAVLVSINTRLSTDEIRYILDHSGSRVLIVDTELAALVAPVIDSLETVEMVVTVDDVGTPSPIPSVPFDEFVERGGDEPRPWTVDDEDRTISINYTSGTTGRPKGVMYTHRGAYLNAIGEMVHSGHSTSTVYLWTLPMFHCNGWCTTWGVTAVGGRHVCLRAIDSDAVWRLIRSEEITHLNGAPTVLIGLANASEARPVDRPLTVTTAGAPPSPTVIEQMTDLGARLVHVYGLTETYGPHTVCEWQTDWAHEPVERRVKLMARQGVAFVIADPIRVVDDQMRDVARDGATMGEVVMRGNNVMKGYFADEAATAQAFRGGWFHSGDLAVWHPDGYIELRDRAKDIIISGGENISTIEVEQAVASHPAVLECAVIAIPHDTWGERPKAFVLLKPGMQAEEAEIIDHVRDRLAHFKAPDAVEIVTALPKTSTGKIQKFVLREREWSERDTRIN
jgi:fatty-acyl-CoA synthase